MIKRFLASLALILICTRPSQAVHIEQDPNYSLYDNVLQSCVNADGLVDYMGLRATSLKDLQTVVQEFGQADLGSMDYPEKMAFWINAYNANLLLLLSEDPDMKSVTDHPQIWTTALTVAKGHYSLQDIEHRIIRGKNNPKTGEGPIKRVTLETFDPRVHFALATGTIGGPTMQNFAYTSKNLEQSLRKNSSEFVNSPRNLRIEKGHLVISSLMNEYAEDFNSWGGSASYLNRLVDTAKNPEATALKKLLLTEYTQAEFISDLTLNDIRHAPTKRPKLLNAPK